MTAAALGTTLNLPTLEADLVGEGADQIDPEDASIQIDLKPGTQSGTDHVLRGRGVPGLRGGRGDLIVTINVETPTKLDLEQEALLRQLAEMRGEESVQGQLKAAHKGGVFSWFKDTLNGH